jgi:hypothetical protein
MFKRFIKNIRRKPKTIRNKVALVTASLFTTCIFVVWLYHIPNHLSAVTSNNDKDSSPIFSQLLDKIGDNISSVKNAVSDDLNSEKNLVDSESEIIDEQYEETAKISSTSSAVTPPEAGATEFYFSPGSENIAPSSTVRAIRITTTGSSTATKSAEIE